MRKVIHKHLITPGVTYLTLKHDSVILKVSEQDGEVVLWEEHEDLQSWEVGHQPDEMIEILTQLTGVAFDEYYEGNATEYLDTVQLPNGIVVHVYKVVR